MNPSKAYSFLVSFLLLNWGAAAADLGTMFSYGGSLRDGGAPAQGTYEFQASLYSALTGGTKVAGPIQPEPARVVDGRFSLELDFGAGVIAGDASWLEIGVRTNGAAGDFVVLSPRQRLTPVPYALLAGSVPDGAITQGKLAAGAVTASSLAAGSVGAGQLAPGAAAANLASNALSGVPSGGLILSPTDTNAALDSAGYTKIGATQVGDTWHRLANSVVGPSEQSPESVVWTGDELIAWTGLDGWRYHRARDSWRPINVAGAPTPRTGQTTIWTGTELIVWGGNTNIGGPPCADGGRYNPSTDLWTPISPLNAPRPWEHPAAVWTGTDLIVWGGTLGDFGYVVEGKRYDPVLDRWTNMSSDGAPHVRTDARAVWTGTEMFVWGGQNNPQDPEMQGDGGRYDPVTDRWTPVSTNGAPRGRIDHVAVWSGGRIYIWGGIGSVVHDLVALNDGAVYYPDGDSWAPMSAVGAPSRRFEHSGVWSPGGMIVWGGRHAHPVFDLNDGVRYDADLDRWFPIAANSLSPGRAGHAAFWNTAGNEMLVWGGGASQGLAFTPDYNLEWGAMSMINAPAARWGHTTVWTGTEMIVWGGDGFNDGARYELARDVWVPLPAPPANLGKRFWAAAAWTGTDMIILGGYGEEGAGIPLWNGARYNMASGTWRSIPSANGPTGSGSGTAVWTGRELIVCGGTGEPARYDPVADVWRGVSASPLAFRRGHTAVWTGTKMILWGGELFEPGANTGAIYDPVLDSWIPLPGSGAPSPRSGHTAVWTGTEMIVWGGGDSSGGRYNPVENSWRGIAESTWYPEEGAPSPRWFHTAVWTGSRMFVWGGENGQGDVLGDGGGYDPVSDTWSKFPSDWLSLSARTGHSGVWTGDRAIIWGGRGPSGIGNKNDGGIHRPAGGTWTPLAAGSPDAPRAGAASVWTGQEMLIWGGQTTNGYLGNGLSYDRTRNSWRALPLFGALVPREGMSAVWTGTEMLVWGGHGNNGVVLGDGAAYNTGTRRWRTLTTNSAPSARAFASGIWTGTEFIIWGGMTRPDGDSLSDGARYDPRADRWIPMNPVGAPALRAGYVGVWTGTELLAWGVGTSGWLAGGGRYKPATDTWSPMSSINAPVPRVNHAAVWTGTEMLLWAGRDGELQRLATGGRYDPVTDRWTPMTERNAPSARAAHSAFWTGTEMLIWGGIGGDVLGTGGRYDPFTDGWKPMVEAGAPPPGAGFAAVWTGTEMLIHAGTIASSQAAETYSYVPAKTFFLYQRR